MLPPICEEEKFVRWAVDRETIDSLSSEREGFVAGRLAKN